MSAPVEPRLTLEDLRKAEVAVRRQEKVVETRRRRLREEEDALATLRAEEADRAERYAKQVAGP